MAKLLDNNYIPINQRTYGALGRNSSLSICRGKYRNKYRCKCVCMGMSFLNECEGLDVVLLPPPTEELGLPEKRLILGLGPGKGKARMEYY